MNNDEIKREIKEMLKEIGVGKRTFFDNLPRVKDSGDSFVKCAKGEPGRKPSLKEMHIILKEILTHHRELKVYFDEARKRFR